MTRTDAAAGNDRLSPPVRALLRQAEETPDRTVLVADREKWTSRRLAEQAGRLAAGLAARGVKPGDRVALHMQNTVEAVLGYLACLRLGAVAVALNTRLATPELRNLVARVQPKIYLGQDDAYPRFAAIPEDLVPIGSRFLSRPLAGTDTAPWPDLAVDDAGRADAEPDPGAPAVLLPTSGTTGESKIVIWTHRMLARLGLTAPGRGIGNGEVISLMTPLMHAMAVYCLFSAVTQGATAVLIRQFDAADVLDAVERDGITMLAGLPFMYAELAREQQSRPRDVSTLRTAVVAGDVCPAAVEADFGRVFGVPLRSVWAATEEAGVTVPGPRPGPYINVIPQARAEVVRPDGRKAVRGEVGELVTSSPTTTPGYWQGAAGPTPLPGGVFRTGDLVRELSPGLLQYMGRKKDLIIRGGSNISPQEVEEVLRAHPAVTDAGVAGYPDDVLGQRVGALIVPGGRTSAVPQAEEIRTWARQRLADYKVPERIMVTPAIPRNAVMKTDRAAVAAALSAPDVEENGGYGAEIALPPCGNRRRCKAQCRRGRPAGRSPDGVRAWARQLVESLGRGDGRTGTDLPLPADRLRPAGPRRLRHRPKA
jgi:long-chain acyl-CoA synthetase